MYCNFYIPKIVDFQMDSFIAISWHLTLYLFNLNLSHHSLPSSFPAAVHEEYVTPSYLKGKEHCLVAFGTRLLQHKVGVDTKNIASRSSWKI